MAQNSDAWRLTPHAYVARRTRPFRVPPAPASRYVTMPDGCRLAVDLYLPQAAGGGTAPGPFPAITIFTPYYRRFALADPSRGDEAAPGVFRYRDLFVPAGYALVVIDVRGTGASFGTRDSFRSPREREDCRAIADWIVAQPWSNGAIGATGVSYLGAAADFLASTGHPAVKAIAPLFAVWDTWSDHYYPGGIHLKELARVYDELMVAMDHDRRDLLKKISYYANPNLAGPRPVDADADGSLCRAAIGEHASNFRMPDFITEFKFKDDSLPYDPDFTVARISPYGYCEGVGPDVAVYSVSGWMDGAGYANGAISRFLTLPNRNRHLLLGPWDHGARIDCSPWRRTVEADFPIVGEMLRFFDEYLMGLDTGLRQEAPVHYFTQHDEVWRAAESWPPVTTHEQLFLDADARLTAGSVAPGTDDYRVDFAMGTGGQTRYERIAAIDSRDYYIDWPGRGDALLHHAAADRRLGGVRPCPGRSVCRLERTGRRDLRLPVGGRSRRHRALRHRRTAAGAASPGKSLPAGASHDLALSQLRPCRRGTDGGRQRRALAFRPAADVLDLQGGQPGARGHRRGGCRPLRAGAAWTTAAADPASGCGPGVVHPASCQAG